ncbi:calcium-dependent secretion activator-like [Varroa destructor]|uniref:Uncharacterized protein n=1 Tax=Varroa destructor TaxID=109461 RepID=A0A7M7JWM4_VARDE|nr:calcium-dependent secretion activator-like [Varroa destructor]
MLEPSSSEDEEGDEGTVEDVSEPPTVRVSSSVTTLEFPSSGITTRSISPAATESVSSVSLAASGLPAIIQQRSNSLRPTSPAPITLLQEQVKAPQNQSSQAHQQGQAAVQPGSQPPSSEETGVDLMPQNEEEERRKRLQLYVFILRCVAYPFNAKQPNDMSRRQMKVTKEQLETLQKRFQAFLKGETTIAADEAFQNAVQSYTEVFLKSDRVAIMVVSRACSQHDFREVFRNNIEKRVRSLPEIDGLSKETVLTSWMTKFDAIFRGDEDSRKAQSRLQQQNLAAEMVLSKEQLYDMFQNILNIKKFEHQLLYNALQLDSADEQAAAIRRELDGKVQKINELEKNRKLLPKFVVKEMELLFIEEMRSSINQLMANLEGLPVTKGSADSKYGLQKLRRYNHSTYIIMLCKEEYLGEPAQNVQRLQRGLRLLFLGFCKLTDHAKQDDFTTFFEQQAAMARSTVQQPRRRLVQAEQLQAVNFYKFTIKIASLKQSDKLTSPTYNDKLQLRDSVPAQQCQNNNLSRPQNHFAVSHPSQGIVRTEGVRRAETGGVKGGATHGSALRGVRSQE